MVFPTFCLIKTLENFFLLTGIDTTSGIAELHHNITCHNINSDFNAATIFDKFKGIRQQIHDYFSYFIIVKIHRNTRLLTGKLITDPPLLGYAFERLELVFYQTNDITMNILDGLSVSV